MLAELAGLRQDAAMDFAAAGLLEGLEGDEREARCRLLERLAEEGFTLDELRSAVQEDRLSLLLVERVLGGSCTIAEVAERTGLPASVLVRVRHLLGLREPGPEDRAFAEAEVAAARSFRLLLQAGLGEEVLAELTRVMGESMSRLAAATAAAFVDAFLEAGDSEEDVAMRFATLAEELVPAYGPVLIAAYEAHLRESVRRGMIGRVERESGTLGSEQQLTVCFADLVGFTRLGGQVEARELGSVAGTLAELAADLAESPVRLVKTI